jgi:hypothetical protein
MRLLPTSPAGSASFWAALSLIAMLPLAAALDPSGSTEPGNDSDSQMSTTATARPATSPPGSAGTKTPTSTATTTGSDSTHPGSTLVSSERRSDTQRTDIADTAQLSPDGSSSLETATPQSDVAIAEAATAVATRREALKLTPARPSLNTATQQTRWSELSDGQRSLLAPFEDQWSELTAREKQALAHMAERFPDVTPDDHERSMKRLAAWAELTPDDRRLARYGYRWMRQLDRNEVMAAWKQYQSLTPAQRAVLAAAGSISTTAATHPGRRTGLAADAAQPLPRRVLPAPEIPGL